MLKAEILVSPPTAEQLRISELGKQATAIKSKDIRGAVECIQEAQAIARKIGASGHPIEFWLRLPLFLEQAGDIAAAEAAFDQIEQEIRSGVHGRLTRANLRILKRKRDLARTRASKRSPKK